MKFNFDSKAPLAGEKPKFVNKYSNQIAVAVICIGIIVGIVVYKVLAAANHAGDFAHWLMPAFF